MNRKTFVAGLTAAAGAPMLAARRGETQELVAVRVGALGIATDAPIWIADEKGFFRQNGIRIEISKFTSSETMMPLLSTGQLDVGAGAPGASLYNAVLRGVDVRAVADAATDPPGYGWSKLLMRSDLVKSGRFRELRDLKGMTVAGAARASSSAAQMARLVRKAGIRYEDVKRTVLAYPEHTTAFQNGAIEAALTIEPFATRAVESGAATFIIGNDQFYPNQEVTCLLCSSELIRSKRDLVVRYLRGFLLGVRFYEDAMANGKLVGRTANDVVRTIAAHTGADEAMIRRTTPVSIDPDGRLNVASMREDLAFYQSQHFIEGPITVERVIDTTLSADALRTIRIVSPGLSETVVRKGETLGTLGPYRRRRGRGVRIERLRRRPRRARARIRDHPSRESGSPRRRNVVLERRDLDRR